MNINRRITSITITTRRRDVVYKRTPSDLTNHNCVVPATYRAPLVQCCKPLPVKKPTTKKASKVTWRSLITPFWLRANVFCRRLDTPDAVNLTIVVLSRWSRVVTCMPFVLRLLLLQTSFPVPAVLLYRPSHLIRSVWRSPPLAHFLQPAVVARPFYCSSSDFFFPRNWKFNLQDLFLRLGSVGRHPKVTVTLSAVPYCANTPDHSQWPQRTAENPVQPT